MRFWRQVFAEFRRNWQLGGSLSVLVAALLAAQNPVTVVSTDGWIVTATVAVAANFGAVFTIFILGAYTAIEDSFNSVYHRLLVYPVSFPTMLAARSLPVAAWAMVAAATVAVGLWATASVAAWRIGVAVFVVGVFTVPVATLVTLLYLRVNRPRVATLLMFGALYGAANLPEYLLGPTTTGVTVAIVVCLAAIGSYALTYLIAARTDPERLVV